MITANQSANLETMIHIYIQFFLIKKMFVYITTQLELLSTQTLPPDRKHP